MRRPGSSRLRPQTSGDGAKRARTADLLGAIQALSQLSYSPEGPNPTNTTRAAGRSQGVVSAPGVADCSPPPPAPPPLPPDARPSSPFDPVLPPIEVGRGLVVFFFAGAAGVLGAAGVVVRRARWAASLRNLRRDRDLCRRSLAAHRRLRREACKAAWLVLPTTSAGKLTATDTALRRRSGHRHDGRERHGRMKRIRQRAQRNQPGHANASQCPSWDPRPVHRLRSIIFPCTCPVPTLISVCCRLSACEPVTLRVGVPPRVGILHGLQAPASDLLPNSNGTSPPCGRVDDPTHRYREPQDLDRPAFGDWGWNAWIAVCSRFGQWQACPGRRAEQRPIAEGSRRARITPKWPQSPRTRRAEACASP